MRQRLGWIIIIVLIFYFCLSFTTIGIASAEQDYVYLGGMPIGIGLAEEGLIVTGIVDVITDEGAVCPARGSEISTGDVMIRINDHPIVDLRDLAYYLQSSSGSVSLTLKRGKESYNTSLIPVTDSLTGLKKLGLTVKNGISGIGTLTYITPDSSFGALGHGVIDVDTGKPFISDQGSVYSCTITGYRKASAEKAGELIGSIGNHTGPIGKIDRCNAFGVYGTMKTDAFRDLIKIQTAKREEVHPGKAYIFTTIDGTLPQKYEIEIVRAREQESPKEKSMLIKVVDKDLLEKTGGILQGMSGSPIVQDDKLVGAVTHVLLNDSALGYGLYLDWMLPNER